MSTLPKAIMPLSAEQETEFCDRWERGELAKDIAAAMGISRQMVAHWRKHLGLPAHREFAAYLPTPEEISAQKLHLRGLMLIRKLHETKDTPRAYTPGIRVIQSRFVFA